jgi:hypothetical protein
VLIFFVVLQAAASEAVDCGFFENSVKEKFHCSITEHEVIQGLLQEAEQSKRCIAVVREIEDLETTINVSRKEEEEEEARRGRRSVRRRGED